MCSFDTISRGISIRFSVTGEAKEQSSKINREPLATNFVLIFNIWKIKRTNEMGFGNRSKYGEIFEKKIKQLKVTPSTIGLDSFKKVVRESLAEFIQQRGGDGELGIEDKRGKLKSFRQSLGENDRKQLVNLYNTLDKIDNFQGYADVISKFSDNFKEEESKLLAEFIRNRANQVWKAKAIASANIPALVEHAMSLKQQEQELKSGKPHAEVEASPSTPAPK